MLVPAYPHVSARPDFRHRHLSRGHTSEKICAPDGDYWGIHFDHALLRAKSAGFSGIKPCVSGVPCSGQYINWFGFITIPFLALIAFILTKEKEKARLSLRSAAQGASTAL